VHIKVSIRNTKKNEAVYQSSQYIKKLPNINAEENEYAQKKKKEKKKKYN